MERLRPRLVFPAALAVLAVAFGACGGSEAAEPAGGGEQAPSEDAGDAGHPDGRTASGPFELLSGRPDGFDDLKGEAKMVRSDRGTKASLELSGLEPDTDYAAHVHAEPCSEEKGGPHFQFDPEGSNMPPNEIHLGFTSDSEGRGMNSARNPMEAPSEARSVVVHQKKSGGATPRIACADLSEEGR